MEPSFLTVDYMTDILRKSLNAPQIVLKSMEIKPGSSVGDNYVSMIFRIKLEIENDGETQKISVIAKTSLENKISNSIIDMVDVFGVEATFFNSTLKQILKTVENFAPKCYYVDFPNTALFLEDLSVNDYVLQPKGKFLDLTQCVLVMEALGSMHGGSYNAVEDNPSLISQYSKTIWDGQTNDLSDKINRNTQLNLEKYVETYGLSDDYRRKLLKFEERYQGDELKKMAKNENNINVLLHGDCWMNNMLFHFNDGKPNAVKLLDFQLVSHGSFAQDLHYFIFSSAAPDVITEKLDFLLEVYHKQLKRAAPNIPNLTLERIKREFNEIYIFGFLMAISFRAFILGEARPDMDDVLNGKVVGMGFSCQRYIDDLNIMLPFLESVGIF